MVDDIDNHMAYRDLVGSIAAARAAARQTCEDGELAGRRLVQLGFVDESYLVMLFREREAFQADLDMIASMLDASPQLRIMEWAAEKMMQLCSLVGQYQSEISDMINTEEFKQADAADKRRATERLEKERSDAVRSSIPWWVRVFTFLP